MTDLQQETAISAEEFKHAFRNHPAGVAIVTADTGDGPVAMTVSSLFSVSIDPPTLVFSASSMSSAAPTILSAKHVVVHLLSADQIGLGKLGATSGADRFGEGVEWGRLDTGEPYYPQASWLRGRVVNRIPAGGSTLVVVEPTNGKPYNADDDLSHELALVYHNRTWHALDEKSRIG